MKIYNPLKISLRMLVIISTLLLTVSLAHAAVPAPWVNQDIGGQISGSANFLNNQFTLNAAGIDIGGSFDTFHYIYQPFNGDVEVIAKVESIGNSNVSAKAGVMIREALTTGSKNAYMALTYGSTSLFQRRTSTNGGTSTTSGTSVRAPYWVKLTRLGSVFKAYQSADGISWTQVGSSVSITMTSSVYVGLAATSKDLTKLNANIFSNVSVRPATVPVAPVLNTAAGGVAQVDLSWSASATATSYKVKYGTVSGNYTTTLPLGNVTSTSVTGLPNGTLHYFVVTAVNDYGESGVSNQMSATPLDPPTVFIKKIDYNAMGQKTRIEYGNGVITTNTYDPLNLRLKRIYSVNASGMVLQDLSYTYDSAGNILSIADALNTSSQTFQYDALNRLTQAVGSTYGTKTYQYDPIGNIVQKDGKIYSYAEGGAGVHAVTSLSDGTTMTYDANGNMATKQKGTEISYFDYDVENRLMQIQKDLTSVPKASAKIIAQYAYDGDGGRVKKTVGSNVTRYVGSLYEETNGIKTRHIFVGDLKVASITSAQQMYYLPDHLGGTNVLTDKTGVKKEVMEYEPFGTFSRHDKYGTGAEVAQFYFTGQKFDEESGLYYYNARYYDPGLGRFITADTIVQDPEGNPQTFNRYSYTGNNPVNYTDPTGHFFGFIIATIVKAVMAAATYIAANAAVIATGALIGGVIGGVSSVVMGGNFWQGAAIGAIGGAAFAGIAPAFSGIAKTIMTGTSQISLIGSAATIESFTTGFLAGAAAGAATAAYTGSNVGRGALSGGALGAVGSFGAPNFKPFGSGKIGSVANRMANTSATGAATGAAYAGITGRDISEGAKRGAIGWLAGETFNMAVSHSVGFLASGKAPIFKDGVFYYDAKNWGGWITFGNVVTGPYDALTVNMHYMDDYTVQHPSLTYKDHELGHMPQGTLLGAGYIPAHVGSMVGGTIYGIFRGHMDGSHRYGPLETTFQSAPANWRP